MKNGPLLDDENYTRVLGWVVNRQQARSSVKTHVFLILLVLILSILVIVILALIFSTNPCDDFYLFSCGSFLQDTNPDIMAVQSVSDAALEEIQSRIKHIIEQPVHIHDREALKQAKKFYRACTNEADIEREGLRGIKDVFRAIKGWPSLNGSGWRGDEFRWEEALRELRRMGISPDLFFKVSVDRDSKDETKYVLGIHAMTYSPSNIKEDHRKMYLDYMVGITQLFGAKPDIAWKNSNEVIDLLLKLARIYEESVSLNRTGLYDVYSISELQYSYPSINWREYLNGTLQPVEIIQFDDAVVVSEPLYLTRVIETLKSTPKRTLANFIAWQTLQPLINYLPAKILDKAYEYLRKVNSKISREPRWLTCVEATKEKMGSVISAAYIEYFFDDKSRSHIENMIANIKLQFKNSLLKVYWLDKQTKDLIIEHMLNNYEDVGSYDDLVKLHFENEAYEQVDINEKKLLQSVLNLNAVNLNLKYGKLRKPFKENWLAHLSFVTGLDAHYSPKENVLRFPAGIFRGVYYQDDRPNYMNYGALGSVIAHEISHVFMRARDPGSPGELRSRWSMDSLVEYGGQLKCLSEQYEKLSYAGQELDLQKTRDEDVADLAGMKIAYQAYLHWMYKQDKPDPILPALQYTPNQLFWISSAIIHCARYSDDFGGQWSPPQLRVNGPLRNINEFSIDFGCPVGSKMNPEEKCYIW